MKPKIGEKVWCIYDYQIIGEVVEYLGVDSFLIEGYADKHDPCYSFTDYNKTWFRDLEKAKKFLLKQYKKGVRIEQYYNTDIYEIVDEEDED